MKYYIAYKSHYYNDGSTGLEQDPDYSMEPTPDQLTYALPFDSAESAMEWINSTESGIYRLDSNEYARPTYKVINEDDAYHFSALLEHADMSDNRYGWDHCVDPCNPTDDEILLACRNAELTAFDDL
jgi:hypothetical protein